MADFNREAYDMVITDLTMPSMDGWTLTRLIKEQSPGTTVVMMTGWDKKAIAPRLKRSAVDYVLYKPLGHKELKCIIQVICG